MYNQNMIFYYHVGRCRMDFGENVNRELEAIKVSIIIPFFNRIELTISAIESVVLQTYQNWELILIDDCSMDPIDKITKRIVSDKRIRMVRQINNMGAAAARNRGIELSTGDYIAFLDSDDEYLPDKLLKQVDLMVSNDSDISHTSYIRRGDSDGIVIRSGKLSGNVIPKILESCPIATPTVMIKTDIISGNRFPENNRIGEDVCFWISLLKNHELLGIDEALSIVNVSETSASLNSEKQVIGLRNILTFVLRDDYLCTFNREIDTLCHSIGMLSRQNELIEYPEQDRRMQENEMAGIKWQIRRRLISLIGWIWRHLTKKQKELIRSAINYH